VWKLVNVVIKYWDLLERRLLCIEVYWELGPHDHWFVVLWHVVVHLRVILLHVRWWLLIVALAPRGSALVKLGWTRWKVALELLLSLVELLIIVVKRLLLLLKSHVHLIICWLLFRAQKSLTPTIFYLSVTRPLFCWWRWPDHWKFREFLAGVGQRGNLTGWWFLLFKEGWVIAIEFRFILLFLLLALLLFIGVPIDYRMVLCLIRVGFNDLIDKLVLLEIENLNDLLLNLIAIIGVLVIALYHRLGICLLNQTLGSWQLLTLVFWFSSWFQTNVIFPLLLLILRGLLQVLLVLLHIF